MFLIKVKLLMEVKAWPFARSYMLSRTQEALQTVLQTAKACSSHWQSTGQYIDTCIKKTAKARDDRRWMSSSCVMMCLRSSRYRKFTVSQKGQLFCNSARQKGWHYEFVLLWQDQCISSLPFLVFPLVQEIARKIKQGWNKCNFSFSGGAKTTWYKALL